MIALCRIRLLHVWTVLIMVGMLAVSQTAAAVHAEFGEDAIVHTHHVDASSDEGLQDGHHIHSCGSCHFHVIGQLNDTSTVTRLNIMSRHSWSNQGSTLKRIITPFRPPIS